MKKLEILGLLVGMGVFFLVFTMFDKNSLTDKGILSTILLTLGWGCFMMLCKTLLKKRIRKSESNEYKADKANSGGGGAA